MLEKDTKQAIANTKDERSGGEESTGQRQGETDLEHTSESGPTQGGK